MQSKDVLLMANQTCGMLLLPLLEDLKSAPLVRPTDRGGNHAHWILGHLVLSEYGTQAMMDGTANAGKELEPYFGRGTEPSADGAGYPSYDELLETFQARQESVLAKLSGITEEDLDQECIGVPAELKPLFGTRRQVYLMRSIHWANHRGQLADCRRAAGRKPLML